MTEKSTLELAVGGLPFPHGDSDGGWRYRHAMRPEGHTAPAVRFSFDFVELAARTDAAFDGVHPVKIKGSLPLEGTLQAIVVNEGQTAAVEAARASRWADRVVVLAPAAPDPGQWAAAADAAARQVR